MPATPVDPFGGLAYLQVADDVTRRIRAGEITRRLPGERALADEYRVAYQTARRAIDVLRERGLVATAGTRGTYVAGTGPGDDEHDDDES
jgi:DNA-binding GntR family transcriptional regulator